ncbi:MAG: response regulator [Tepidisphaeraceae bacterium]
MGKVVMGTVLIVDDSEDTCKVICAMVGKIGHVGICAYSVPEAMECIGRQRPDVIITDLMLPGESGLELLRAVRADPLTRDVPVIICSAVSEHRYVDEAMRAGATDYWLKASMRVDDIHERLAAYLPNGTGWSESPAAHPLRPDIALG